MKAQLVSFVKYHVHKMLHHLYAKMDAAAAGLAAPPSHAIGTDADEILWIRALYRDPSTRAINIVGPMGERPLHVCSLSAHRFGGTDFEGEGHYMAQGILQAMRGDSEKI